MDAAIYAETDYMRAVSENVIMGQTAPIGTGVFDLYMDDKAEENMVSALDRATPILPHHKGGSIDLVRGGQDTPLPPQTPNTPSAMPPQSETSPSDLRTPILTPDDETDGVQGSAALSPFTPVGETKVTPSVHSETSPAYTERDESEYQTTPASSMGSPAYSLADGTSPSYQSMVATSPAYGGPLSPTSVDPRGQRATSPYHTTPGTSPMYSPPVARGGQQVKRRADEMAAYAPTSPQDTSIHAGLTTTGGHASPGQLGSPDVYSQPSSPDNDMDQSPSYSPLPGNAAERMEDFQEHGEGEDFVQEGDEDDDDGVSSFFDQGDEDDE